MRKIEEFVKEHELKTLSSQEGELLAEGMTGGGEDKNAFADCSTDNCKSGNCVAGCGAPLNSGNCIKGCGFNGGGPTTDPTNAKCG